MTPERRRKAANGDGSLRPDKQGKWVVEVSRGRGPDGKRKRTRRTVATYAEAKALRRQMNAERDRGALVPVNRSTVATFGLAFTREVKAGRIRDTTRSDYEARLRRDINPYLGGIPIQDLTPRHVEHWMTTLRSMGKGVRTINGARTLLFAICKHAQRTGVVVSNVVAATDPLQQPPNARTQVRPAWTVEETAKVLTAAPADDRVDCFLHLMLHTGMRPGEAMGLLWSDVHLDEGYLDVTGTLREERRLDASGEGVVRLVRNPPKTKSSRRRLPITEALHAALERQQMRHDLAALTLGPDWQSQDYVLTTNRGTPISPSNNRRFFRQFLARTRVRYIRPHDLRHTVALLSLNDADIPIEKASQALGHTRIDTTKQIYAGNVPKYNGDFIAGIAAVLPGPPQPMVLHTEHEQEAP